ncbi:MAG: ribbon-helix-helix protein, CopG family [Phycisphaerales bacterium]
MLRQATKLAGSYTLRFEPTDGGYVGNPIEMPSVIGFGKSIEASASETIDLLVSALATLIEMGEPVPSPASAAKRDRQVNIRLTADEKERLEEAARQAGFRSISDFLRNAGLDRAG